MFEDFVGPICKKCGILKHIDDEVFADFIQFFIAIHDLYVVCKGRKEGCRSEQKGLKSNHSRQDERKLERQSTSPERLIS